jgi:riboflavin biosynthesis pyrimidine reductase
MEGQVIRLLPQPYLELPLCGLYLAEEIRQITRESSRAFIYSNYVVSLDGRIAVPSQKGKQVVPGSIGNPRDWRLFQELAVQADVLITSGRYLRNYNKRTSQDILEVYDDPVFTDLAAWRDANGLSRHPALAVLSRTLDFEIPQFLIEDQRLMFVVTTEDADQNAVRAILDQGAGVIFAGESEINGTRLKKNLVQKGFRTIYNTAGPKALHLLASEGILDRLYLTYVSRLLGGDPFSPVLEGDLLQPAIDLTLRSIYFDPHLPNGVGQLFVAYDRSP